MLIDAKAEDFFAEIRDRAIVSSEYRVVMESRMGI